MIDDVDQTLHEWRSTASIYGQSDCMLSVGRYVAACGGIDLTGEFMGRYDSHDGAMAQLEQHGGVYGLFARMGLVEVFGEPERGDVVELCCADGSTIGALCTGGMVAARLERGVVEVSLRMVKLASVWRVVQ